MIRLSFIYEDQFIFVELKPDEFRASLKRHFEETQSIDKALDACIQEVKQLTKYQ